MNETNRHADYILPVTTFLERADWPLIGMHVAIRPFIQYTEAVVPPLGETREDYAVYQGLAERLGLGAATMSGTVPSLAGLPVENGGSDTAGTSRRSKIRLFLSHTLNRLLVRVTDSDEPRNSLPPAFKP